MCHRKLLGDELDTCDIEELQRIENQLEYSLGKIRARKVPFLSIKFCWVLIYVKPTQLIEELGIVYTQNQLLREQIEKLKKQVIDNNATTMIAHFFHSIYSLLPLQERCLLEENRRLREQVSPFNHKHVTLKLICAAYFVSWIFQG